MQDAKALDHVINVGFIFGIAQVYPDAPPDYARRHMLQYLAHHGTHDMDEATLGKMIAPMSAIPVASSDALPSLRDSVLRQHAARTACVMQSIQRETPLLEGEVLQDETFTYLNKPFNGARPRSVVLLRTTNFGQLVYLFKEVAVDQDGRLLFLGAMPKVLSDTADTELFLDNPEEVLATIGSKLAGSLLSSLGGAIAKSLFESVFPPGVPSYFDKVYVEMKRIVGQELQQSTIDSVDGAIKNIQQHLEYEYLPAKAARDLTVLEDRKHLFTLLQKYESTFLSGPNGMLGTLMSDKYAKLGFSVFLIAASLQLALFQEMAVVDPGNLGRDGTVRDPLLSSYGRPDDGTVAQAALKYADFAEKLWPKIIADRRAKVHQHEQTLCALGDTSGGSCRNFVWYVDDLEVGEVPLPASWKTKVMECRQASRDKEGNNPNKDLLLQHFEAYKTLKESELRNSLGVPEVIVSTWRQLAKTPLKLPS